MEDEDLIESKMEDDIIKVSSIKTKIKMDVEKIREKISRENKMIIKQQVNHDFAIWDLKEKLKQERRNRDKLQHDIIELQMQYETISGQYQDELRLRGEILNNVNMNGKICEVLQEYEKNLGNNLKQCEEGKATFYKAFRDAAENVRNLTVKYEQEKDKDRQIITALQNEVTGAEEQQQRQLQWFNEAQAFNSNLKNEINDLKQHLNERAVESNNISMQQDTELKIIKEAWRKQQMNRNTLSDQQLSLERERNNLIEKINNLLANISDLKQQLQESNVIIEKKKGDIAALLEDKQCSLKQINEKENLIALHEEKINIFKNEINQMEIEHDVIISDFNKVIEECNTKYKDDTGRVEVSIQNLNKTVEQLELGISNLRVSSENKEKELMVAIEERAKEIELKASANAELISELKIITKVSETLEHKIKNLESTIQEREKDIESKATCITDLMAELNKEVCGRSMLENKIEQLKKEKEDAFYQVKELQNEFRVQEEVWSKKMKLAANTAMTEKVNAQAQIQELQNTIENIRENLEQRPAFEPLQSETEDDAVLPPTSVCSQVVDNSRNLNLDGGDRMFFALRDSLDSVELQRRACAISKGEEVSPVLFKLKRRHEAAAEGTRAAGRGPTARHTYEPRAYHL